MFGFTEARLGLVPAVISPYVLRKVGFAAARELLLTGERFTADRALALGLVQRVVPPGALDAAVDERVGELLRAAPGAIAAAKVLLRGVAGRPVATSATTFAAPPGRRAAASNRPPRPASGGP